MKTKVCTIISLLLLSVAWCHAEVIAVNNFSFELPGTVKIKGWDGAGAAGSATENIPGWSSASAAIDSGVESDPGYPATDGAWTAFLMGADPSVFNLTDHVIAAGEVFELQVDARDTWTSNSGLADLTLMLYYDVAGVRTTVASTTITDLANGVSTLCFLTFSANDVPASIGNKIGIELDNVDAAVGGSWLGLDNVRLVIPYTSLVNPDPDGVTLVNKDEDLAWTNSKGWNVDLYWGPENDPNLSTKPAYKRLSNVTDPGTWDPGTMADGVTYYWRVDVLEPNALGDPIVHAGPVWSFTVAPPNPVFIDGDPGSVTVAAGDPASFTISAINHTGTTWYYSADAAADAGDTVAGSGDTLNLTNVQLANEGWYYAVITNGTPALDQTSPLMGRLMTERLVGYWDFESGSLADAVEGYVGTIADPNFAAAGGLLGDGYAFFGDGRHITIVDADDYYNFYPQGLTANIWVKIPDGIAGWKGAMGKRTKIDGNTGWGLWGQQGLGSSGAVLEAAGAGNLYGGTETATNDDAWHMLTLTYDPVSGAVVYYFDGGQAAALTATAKPATTNAPLTFGDAQITVDEDTWMTGVVDEIKIYTYDIGNKAILDLYNTYVDPDKTLCLNPIDEAMDLVDDCKIDLLDFAEFAAGWLSCGRYPESACD
jgi:hypothetical protein